MRNALVGFVLLLVASSAHAFTLRTAYYDKGVPFCMKQTEAIEVVEIHAVQGLEKAKEKFTENQCVVNPAPLSFIFIELIHEEKEAKLYVYRTRVSVGEAVYEVFAILPEHHETR